MAKIKTLKDYNDEIIYPQSTTRAIVNAEGVNLDTLHSKFVMIEQVTEIEEVDDYYEIRNNKITTINSTSNDENYPSAKAVYDFGMTIKNESIEIAKTEVNELKGMVDEIAPNIPTKTSQLTNDSGYLIQSDISNLATTTYVDNAISNAITTAIGGAY